MFAFRLLLLAALSPVALGAQVIGGRVVDSASRQSLTGVSVTALAVDADSAVSDALTDSTGVFYLRLGRPGSYRLRFHAVPTTLLQHDTIVVVEGDFVEREFALSLPPNPVFFEDQVDSPTHDRRETLSIRYPQPMLSGGIAGSVLATYVVSKAGRVEPTSLQILETSNPLFSEAVVRALRTVQFFPATFRGKPVRQVVNQPFYFCIVSCRQVDPSTRAVIITAVRPEPVAPNPWRRP